MTNGITMVTVLDESDDSCDVAWLWGDDGGRVGYRRI